MRNVEFLRACGVQVLFDPERYPLPDGTNDPRAIFPWDAIKDAVTEDARSRPADLTSMWSAEDNAASLGPSAD